MNLDEMDPGMIIEVDRVKVSVELVNDFWVVRTAIFRQDDPIAHTGLIKVASFQGALAAGISYLRQIAKSDVKHGTVDKEKMS